MMMNGDRSLQNAGHVGFPPRSQYLMLPRIPARAARAGLALYEAVEPKQRLAARAGEVLTSVGLSRLLPSNDRPEVDWAWWTAYMREIAEPIIGPVHHLAFRVPGNPRVSALLMNDAGRPVAFAKLLNSEQPAFPAAASRLLSESPVTSFRIPAVLAEGFFNGHFYRLTEPMPEGTHRPPPHDPSRLWMIVDEFRERLAELPRPHRIPDHYAVCHADLTPRNLRLAADGQWWLFDWDNVRWGPRLSDELRFWAASFAYEGSPHLQRDGARILELLRMRGSDSDIREAVNWPGRVRQTYRAIEPRLHAEVGRLVEERSTLVSKAKLNRAPLWLPLLKRLTDEVPSWVVWKRAEPAFTSPEDIDAVAPRADWPKVEAVFRDWASAAGFTTVACRHIPSTLNLFALVDEGHSLLQLEIKDRVTFRGSVHFTAKDLLPLAHLTDAGYRALRPGAEAALKLTLHGLRPGGRPNWEAIEEHELVDMLRHDPDGATAAAAIFGWARRPMIHAIEAAVNRQWSRKSMLVVELRATLRALIQPWIGLERIWFRRFTRPRCPVLQTVYRDARRIEGNNAQWLTDAARGHAVTCPGPSAPTSGKFVILVGPDGVGKTTVARELLNRHPGPTGYIYFRPTLNGSLDAAPPVGPRPRGNKHPAKQPQILGWMRLAKNIAWFWAGYLKSVRPILRHGGFVVGDRWAYGYPVQPGPLAYFGPTWLARLGVRMMPRPDLLVNLEAPPEVIVARKDELTAAEAARELKAWRKLPIPCLQTVDASPPPGAVAEEVIRLLTQMTRTRS